MTPTGIAVNGRFLTQPVTGVQRYAHELLLSLDAQLDSEQGPSPEIEVLVPPTDCALPSYRNISVRRVGRHRGQLWEQLDLASHCRGRVLFTPCGGAPVTHSRHVITIHDAAEFAVPEA